MWAKAKLNLGSVEMDPTLFQNTEKLLNPAWISNSGRQFSEWAVVFFYFQKSQVKIEYILFVSTHVP